MQSRSNASGCLQEPRLLKILLVPASMFLLWYLVGATLIWFPGLVYSVEEPVKVLAVHEASVQLELTRTAKIEMAAVCTRQVVCENVVTMASEPCPVVTVGTQSQHKEFPIPEHAFNGYDSATCFMQGTIALQPMSSWGPTVSVPWRSETFEATRPIFTPQEN